MSDEWLRLDGDRAAAGARDMHAAGEQLDALHRGPAGELAAASAAHPWGGDAYGHSFERHYRPAEQSVLEAWGQLAAYLTGLGEAAGQSVIDNLGADDDARHRFRRRP